MKQLSVLRELTIGMRGLTVLGCLSLLACSAGAPDSEHLGTLAQDLTHQQTYVLTNVDGGRMEVENGSPDDGADIQLGSDSGDPPDRAIFRFVYHSLDYSWKLKTKASGFTMCVRAVGEGEEGDNVQQGPCTGSQRTRWFAFYLESQGAYILQNKVTELCATREGAGLPVSVVQSECDWQSDQLFYIDEDS